MGTEIEVHGRQRPGFMQRWGMSLSTWMDRSWLGFEVVALDDKNVPDRLAQFIGSAEESLFILSDLLNPDLFADRAVLAVLGNARMRKVDMRIVVGQGYDRSSADIIDGSLGGVLIKTLKDERPINYPFITVDGKHTWTVNSEYNFAVCRMNNRRFARQLESRFLKLYSLAQHLLLEPIKIPA